MTEEDKELLLIDLCARLPYETMFHTEKYGEECLLSIDLEYEKVNELYDIQEIKLYLRTMSSMTEEEKDEFMKIHLYDRETKRLEQLDADAVDFYNKHHIDYRGLITMGLALEAPEDMYNN